MLALSAAVEGQPPRLAEVAAAALSCAVLPWCRKRPLAGLALVLTACLVLVYLTAQVFPSSFPVLAALYYIGLTLTVRVTAASTLVILAAVFVTAQVVRHVPAFDLRNGAQLGWFVAASAIGVAVANQRQLRMAADERAQRAEESREAEAMRRVGEERLRIAQELHDVIGHSIAMINVQAGAAAHVIERRPQEARESLQLIRSASTTALEEIRTTLGLLRQGAPGALQVAPVFGLNDVSALVERARAGGLDAGWTLRGRRREVPAVIGATVYRLVQEALTNVLKHAGPGTEVEVKLEFHDRELWVSVTDDGAGTRHREADGGGLGLRGMKERVAAAGGTLDAGPCPPGFRVAAKIPTEASS
ncbi:sensor histidine kinase [Streptomyces sp. MZ04]|uniref:sensor histidine kinase n=1 Tax=Streptomyces sp. MZ04 TaxID=2559236 RepID=UPI001432C370|nr:sensor histidine kinase [Streptomyces sp. MZ04]